MFAYGPADVTAVPKPDLLLPPSFKSRLVLPFWYRGLPMLSRKRGVGCSVVVCQLTHFATLMWMSLSQRLEASVRAIRLGLYTVDNPTPFQLAADTDDYLFSKILSNPHHTHTPV